MTLVLQRLTLFSGVCHIGLIIQIRYNFHATGYHIRAQFSDRFQFLNKESRICIGGMYTSLSYENFIKLKRTDNFGIRLYGVCPNQMGFSLSVSGVFDCSS